VSTQQINSVVTSRSARALLASNVVMLRRAKGWSQEVLAEECGLHRTFVAHVERQARNIAIDNVERIAKALGVEVHVLLSPLNVGEAQ